MLLPRTAAVADMAAVVAVEDMAGEAAAVADMAAAVVAVEDMAGEAAAVGAEAVVLGGITVAEAATRAQGEAE